MAPSFAVSMLTRKSPIAAFLLVLAGVLIAWLAIDEIMVPDIAPHQRTDAWASAPSSPADSGEETSLENQPGISLRTLGTAPSRLLIRYNRSEVVYVYHSAEKNIVRASESEWQKADGEVTICNRQVGGDHNKKINVLETWRDYTIKYAGSDLETYGRYAVGATESPTHTRVAVLSAYGPVKPSLPGLIPGLGGSEPVVYGRRYVQVIGLDGGEPSGETVRLIRTDHATYDRLCWSPDENFLVAYKPFSIFSVIELRRQS